MKKNKNNKLPVVILIVVLGVIAVIAYYFYNSQAGTISQTPIKNNNNSSSSSVQNVPEYRLQVIEGINKKRLELGYKALDIDNNLCALAKLLAEERAVNYPNEVKQDILTDPKYKVYIKNYSNVQQLKFTVNDIFVKAAKEKNQKISFTDDYLIEAYVNTDNAIASPMQSKLTNGCVAISPENVGYKPFAFFVGSVK